MARNQGSRQCHPSERGADEVAEGEELRPDDHGKDDPVGTDGLEEDPERAGLAGAEPDADDRARREPPGNGACNPCERNAADEADDSEHQCTSRQQAAGERRAEPDHERRGQVQQADLALAQKIVEVKRQWALQRPEGERDQDDGGRRESEPRCPQCGALGPNAGRSFGAPRRHTTSAPRQTRARCARNGPRIPPIAPSAGPATAPIE